MSEASSNNKSTICWDCANAYADRCVKFTYEGGHVDVWEIEPCKVKMQYHNGKYTKVVESYVVKSCPNFVSDKKK